MSFTVPNTAEVNLLDMIVGKITNGPLQVHLFVNDIPPAETTALADLTKPSADGYAPVLLTSANWKVVTDATTGQTSATYTPKVSFSIAASKVSVYGYFITDKTGAKLIAVERFASAPLNMPGTIEITPTISLD